MKKTPKELADSLQKTHPKNEGKKRLTQMVALAAFGASVGLTAEVSAGPPKAETRKVTKQVDAKDLKVKRNVDARKVQDVDARKLKVKKVNKIDTRMDSSGGPGKPPPP